ncbi:hypothetical protein [Nocardioides sp. LHG3406-4]|uniref:hypothetical protein n=1 Tax=Nocardioides sp. LHG3406-4 TaxID=2804575 RepID=UPI003CF7DF7A
MNTATRVAGFAVALAAVFALALGVGKAFGPDAEPAPTAHDSHAADEAGAPRPASAGSADIPGGLMVSQDGYTLALGQSSAAAGADVPVRFTITGPDGEPVTAYDVAHDKQLHLIAVRRDFTGFQHVHPELSPDGTWSTALDLTGGQWRLFADFKATGADALTLGADLAVAGGYRPEPPAGDSRSSEVDGYTVTLGGDLAAGADAELTLSVERDGEPVTDLEPYLGAYGHLVALRSGDLAYLHVHPDGTPEDGTTRPGPDIVFQAAVPSTGTYHLYLDFKHRGVVRTAGVTVSADGTVAASPTADSDDGHTDH